MRKATVTAALLFLGIGVSAGFLISVSAEEGLLPSWIKNTARFWADDQISDSEFINALQFLVNKGILRIPEQEIVSQEELVPISPAWNTPVTRLLPTQEDLGDNWQLGSTTTFVEDPIEEKTSHYEFEMTIVSYNYKNKQSGDRVNVHLVKSEYWVGKDPKEVIAYDFDRYISPSDLPSGCVVTHEEIYSNLHNVWIECIWADYHISVTTQDSFDDAQKNTIKFVNIIRDKF